MKDLSRKAMKYVIFDFGQVLVHFEPSYIVARYVSDPSDAALLTHVAFDRLHWDALDAGTMTSVEVVDAIKARVPERLGDTVEQMYYHWIYHIPEMEGMRELILHIKQTYGAKVFVLSNISTYFAEHAHEIPILSLVDGCVFSAVCGMVKPNTDIFVHTCRTFALDPSRGIFIDDKPENVRAAQEVGMQGYVFDGDARALQTCLDHFLQEETL